MVIWSNQLKNGLIQLTTKIIFELSGKKISYLRYRRTFFLLTKSLHDVSIRKIFWKQTNCSQILNVDPHPPAKLAKQKMLDIGNSLRYSPLPTKVCLGPQKQHIFFTNFFFFFVKIPDVVHMPTAAPVATINRRSIAPRTSYQQSDSTLQQSVLWKL